MNEGIALRLDVGTLSSDTRREHMDPPEPVTQWLAAGTHTIPVNQIAAVCTATGNSWLDWSEAGNPPASTVSVLGHGVITVREPPEAIEMALVGLIGSTGVWEWRDSRWQCAVPGGGSGAFEALLKALNDDD
jgi:hypothetical protein